MAALPQRKTTRLGEFDYSTPGAYFVTICVEDRRPTLQSDATKGIIERCWTDIHSHRSHVECDEFVVMPDHVHGILFIHEDPGTDAGTAPQREGMALQGGGTAPRREGTASRAPTPVRRFGPLKRGSLPAIVGGFKSACTRMAGKAGLGPLIWQRGYFEHVIRNEKELGLIRAYIQNNPVALTLAFFQELERSKPRPDLVQCGSTDDRV